MSGSTPVCQRGSVRKCVCRACKPHSKRVHLFANNKKFLCKCKLEDVKGLISESSSSSVVNKDLSKTTLIKNCDCIGCKPVITRKKKRLCTCENAKLYPLLTKRTPFHSVGSSTKRDKIIRISKKKLSEELSLKDSNKQLTESDDSDNFEILAKKSSSFLLQYKEKSDLGTSSSVSILVNPENKNISKTAVNKDISPCTQSTKSLTFSKEKLVVEFDIKRKTLLPFGGFLFELYYSKFPDKSSETEELEEKERRESDLEENQLKENIFRTISDQPGNHSYASKSVEENIDSTKEMDTKEEVNIELPSKTIKESDPESEIKVIKISSKVYDGDSETKPRSKEHDPNLMYYSKYISEHDTKRIIYGLHRLLHNYVLFRCEDRDITEGIISETFIDKLSEGLDMFLKNAYIYDPYYKPISFKRRYGYIEIHLKVGVDDMFANKNRMFKKVFLVLFHRGGVKFILTKYKKPGKMIEKSYNYGVNTKMCQDVWCRVDFITAIVNRRHRRVRHRVIETLYDILISDEKGFFKMIEPLSDLWVCIDFDTESESWSKTERTQFINTMKRESNPYRKENIKHIAPLETQLEKDRRSRKRK